MSTLAMLGGPRAVPAGVDGGPWPVVTAEDEQAVLRVLRGGRLTSTAAGETEVPALERAWADQVGTAHCVAVSSGTAALQIALSALGIGPGDEVVVPALTMNATAQAVRQCGGVPVFADIEPDTFTMDPARAGDAFGPRTAAVLPVHLHGLPADMGALLEAAARRGLPVVEDAAQAHGATWRGTAAGALGALGCFSLHPSKNLPTCGEGGLVTTDSASLYRAAVAIRNFGERPPARTRSYIAHRPGVNARLGPVQAAFTRSQLARLPAYAKAREHAVGTFLDRLGRLPGLRVPYVPTDRTHAWHIVRLRIIPGELDLAGVPAAAVRRTLHRVLRAEGVPVSQYQVAPLPAHPAFRGETSLEGVAAAHPVSCTTVDGTLCLQRRHLGPNAAAALAAYADGFEKVWEHLSLVRRMARAQPADRDWRHDAAGD
ncbi:DegT/DnrJ/EryC1/StrS family aminotransferase [Streptomyces olivaceus]|nr:hypothetical protein BC342_18690 [Streptomyces olivaceus]